MSKRIVFLSDPHIGSEVAVADTSRGKAACRDWALPIRRALWGEWKRESVGEWTKPDILVVNGDAVDGQNRKEGGAGVWDTNILHQIDHAAELIRMWDAKKIYIIRGSKYHVEVEKSAMYAEELLAQRLKCDPWPGQDAAHVDEREHSGWHLYLTVEGVTFHIKHGISVTRQFSYMSTPTAREMLNAKLGDMLRHEAREYRAKVIIRGHAHYYNHVEYSGSDGFVLPCWKGLDDFLLSGNNTCLSADLGYVAFTVNGGEYETTGKKHLFRLSDVQRAPHAIVR